MVSHLYQNKLQKLNNFLETPKNLKATSISLSAITKILTEMLFIIVRLGILKMAKISEHSYTFFLERHQ